MDYCTSCGTEIEDWDTGYYARNLLCIGCYDRKKISDAMRPCERCGIHSMPEQLTEFRKQHVCQNCLSEAKREAARKECAYCHHWIEDWETKFEIPDGHFICQKCHDTSVGKGAGEVCSKCGKAPKFPFFAPDGNTYCENCVPGIRMTHEPMLSRVMNRIRGRN